MNDKTNKLKFKVENEEKKNKEINLDIKDLYLERTKLINLKYKNLNNYLESTLKSDDINLDEYGNKTTYTTNKHESFNDTNRTKINENKDNKLQLKKDYL